MNMQWEILPRRAHAELTSMSGDFCGVFLFVFLQGSYAFDIEAI